MYTDYFGLQETPFHITPDPSFLFLSPHHQEALAHLVYGMRNHGGFIQLTGEVGTGKTTLVRTMIAHAGKDVDIALFLNPKLSVLEFMQTLCEELDIHVSGRSVSIKHYLDALNHYLLQAHAEGRKCVVVIDEAQHLNIKLLEQIRLLTNLETEKHRLLTIILVGQPELSELLALPELRQVAQRITGRYHLLPLTPSETETYVLHRLAKAGAVRPLFDRQALGLIYRHTRGIPRLINVLCNMALLGAYSQGAEQVNAATLRQAGKELAFTKSVAQFTPREKARKKKKLALLFAVGCALVGLIASELWIRSQQSRLTPPSIENSAGPTATTFLETSPEVPAPPVTEEAPVQEGVPVATAPVEPEPTPSITASAPATSEPLQETPVDPVAAHPTLDATSSPPDTGALPPLDVIEQVSKEYQPQQAFLSLLQSWDESATFDANQLACVWAKQHGFFCEEGSYTWSELGVINLPVILFLQNGDELLQALLKEQRGQNIFVLETSHGEVEFTADEISEYWQGEALILYRNQIGKAQVGPGERGKGVLWVRKVMERFSPSPPTAQPKRPNVYDGSLIAKVRQFQEAHGLIADGITGPRTLLYMASWDGPQLKKR